MKLILILITGLLCSSCSSGRLSNAELLSKYVDQIKASKNKAPSEGVTQVEMRMIDIPMPRVSKTQN